MSFRVAKFYGMMRTGTSYFQKIVRMNFCDLKVLSNGMQWKHAYPINPDPYHISKNEEFKNKIVKAYEENAILYLFVIKNPYSWIMSMCKRRRWDINKQPVDFIQDLCFKWNGMVGEYVKWSWKHPDTSRVLRYEDIIIDFDGTLDSLCKDFNLERKDKNKWINVHNEIISSGQMVNKTCDWKKKITDFSMINKQVITLINNIIDPELMESLEYDFV